MKQDFFAREVEIYGYSDFTAKRHFKIVEESVKRLNLLTPGFIAQTTQAQQNSLDVGGICKKVMDSESKEIEEWLEKVVEKVVLEALL